MTRSSFWFYDSDRCQPADYYRPGFSQSCSSSPSKCCVEMAFIQGLSAALMRFQQPRHRLWYSQETGGIQATVPVIAPDAAALPYR